MKVLALETSGSACSVALRCGDEVFERHQVAPRRHGELILPMAEALLAEAGLTPQQLDLIAFGRGPGSFTGLRIACGVAQGIAFAAELPVAPVSTLAAVAQGCWRETAESRIAVANDARMGEVYLGGYQIEDGVAVALFDEAVVAPAAVCLPACHWYPSGSGWAEYGDELALATGLRAAPSECERLPRAVDLLPLAEALCRSGGCVSAEAAAPLYLRDNVAVKSALR